MNRRALLRGLAAVGAVPVGGWSAFASAGQPPAGDGKPEATPATNPELKRLKDEDQADRRFKTPPTEAEWQAISARDRARRAKAREFLDNGGVVTADDYDHAALIFQHGERPEDYELAHELALIAGSLGKFGSLVALAEDRFLQSIGRKQRFGSQFARDGGAGEPPEEGTPTAVTDGLRMDLFAPPLTVVKRFGIRANQESVSALIARVEKRLDPAWQKEKAALPEAARLREAAGGPKPTDADRSFALKLYVADALNTAEDYRNAARLVATGAGANHALLAHELATVAVLRRDVPARPLAATTWDRFQVILWRRQRFGTATASVANGKPVPPVAEPGVTDPMRARLGVPPLAEQMRKAADAGKPENR
jgi:hypothetical protein